jgi:hypothetical protein
VNNTTKYEVGYANNGNIETKIQFIENWNPFFLHTSN